MDKKLKYEQAMINELISASNVIDNLKTIGAGNSAKIERFISEHASRYDITQISIMADLFDFTADQKERAFKASENAQ